MTIMNNIPFQKSRINKAIMAASLGLVTSLTGLTGLQTASADAILFPYFNTQPGYVTLIALANKSSAVDWHWTYRYDDPSTPLINECFHLQGFGTTVANDFVSVDISDTLGTNMGLPTGIDTSSMTFNIGPGWKGLLTVYNYTGTYPGTPTGESTLIGEASVVNLSSGEIFKYQAPNDFFGTSEGNLDDMAYGAAGGVTGSTEMPSVIWHPTSLVDTSFYVVVADIDMAVQSGFSSPSAAITLADVNGTPGNFYDVNGNLFSATSGLDVTCFDTFSLSDFLPGASLTFAAGGGWANVQITDLDLETAGTQAPFSLDRGILVYKKETSALFGGINTWVRQNRIEY